MTLDLNNAPRRWRISPNVWIAKVTYPLGHKAWEAQHSDTLGVMVQPGPIRALIALRRWRKRYYARPWWKQN